MKRLLTNFPVILVISVFFPYVFKDAGIRFEHFMIYPVMLFTMYSLLVNSVKVINPLLYSYGLWLSFIMIAIVRTVLSNEDVIIGTALADLDNFLQPLCVMTIFVFTHNQKDLTDTRMLEKVSMALIVMLSINSLWIGTGMIFDTSAISSYFWKGEVAFTSLSNGRYAGIFNQPMESGFMYSLGVFAWAYLVEKKNKLTLLFSVSLVLMIAGGVVSVSKVFIFGGLPLLLISGLFNTKILKHIIKLIFLVIPLMLTSYFFLYTSWNGLDYFLRLFRLNTENFINKVTAGRFGGNNTVVDLFSNVWENHPIYGLGLGRTRVVDSEYFEFFGTGGLIGIAILFLILLNLIYVSFKFGLLTKWCAESRFFGLTVVLIVFGSIGSPVLTLNRSSIVLWVLIGLLARYYYHYRKSIVSDKPEYGMTIVHPTNKAM